MLYTLRNVPNVYVQGSHPHGRNWTGKGAEGPQAWPGGAGVWYWSQREEAARVAEGSSLTLISKCPANPICHPESWRAR